MENRRLKNVGGIFPLCFRKPGVLVIIILVWSAFGCSRKGEKPAGILSQEEMVKVLMEIYVNEEKVNRLSLPFDSAVQVFGQMEKRMYEKAGVEDSVFHQSLDYYFDHPAELQAIYSAVVDSLQLREQRAPSPAE